MRRTKIICTLGPACDDLNILRKMVQAGMNVARLNLSHGTQEEHEERIRNIRAINRETAILVDLQGPRIRTGTLRGREIELKAGARVTLTSKNIPGDEKLVSISPAESVSKIKKGDTIFLSDGTIKLKVISEKKERVECRVLKGGPLGEHKGVNLPNSGGIASALTVKDKKDAAWAARCGVDLIALSFVRKPEDILELKRTLRQRRAGIPVIAKIEKAEAVKNLREIVAAADGVMVARGDLGVELNLEKVPLIQKEIIELCRTLEKPVIVATQMLESMVKEPAPTRAEVSDVANAIFDGTDAVMLSEETSVGAFPVEAVRTMGRIAHEAEKKVQFFPVPAHLQVSIDDSVAHAACVLAEAVRADAIISFTETGSTALRVSKQRPNIPVFGIVTNDKTLRRLALFFGVYPQKIGSFRYIDEMILKTEEALLKSGNLKKNDLVVITAGVPINVPGTTNLIKVHRIGEKGVL